MDQLGNTGRTTEEPDHEDQQPAGQAGEAEAPCPPVTLAVYRADLATEPSAAAHAKPGTESADHSAPDTGPVPAGHAEAAHPGAPTTPESEAGSSAPDAGAAPANDFEAGNPAFSYPDGFTGTLALQNLESFDDQAVGETLSRVAHLISWGQALQARLVNRMGELFRDDRYTPSARIEPGMAFSLAASECAAILHVPRSAVSGSSVKR
ncbi:hypothetical protein [Arthrobacter sp. zg-Y769]|uniref:hypothetical protein n=1 Tax=Arthrobacter sp. zg-Y769 TaxID=2894191 RepID=UPI001E4F80C3|nr:hypothetical protein [Arthrobacter sp. zg-Y769]MCC9203467.1 hypothetical protein [Arthrobacter sp. zg-Y769]